MSGPAIVFQYLTNSEFFIEL